jgi:L-threonylcarbamoyladenylate synthase
VGDVELTLPPDAVVRMLAGELAVLPTDTVYGIAAAAVLPEACERLYRLKQRPLDQPTAVMAGSLEGLVRLLPELSGRAEAISRRLLPGPVTLIVPNPAGRFAHLCGGSPHAIGVRVPRLDAAVASLADQLGGMLITSANARGGADPARLVDVPASIREAAGFGLDGGDLPGVPSTVIDITGREPRILRRGAAGDATLAELA